jgi:hypothetical protein
MPVYRVDLLNGKFYIGRCGGEIKRRLMEHRCPKGSGMAKWFPDEDISTATIREIGRETETETQAEVEDRFIQMYLDDAMCLNRNRGYISTAERTQKAREINKKYMAEHPEKKAEYDASYRQRHLEERRATDATHYQRNKEKIIQRQMERYAEKKEAILAREKAKRDAMTPEEKQKKLDAMKVYREKKKAEKSLGE